MRRAAVTAAIGASLLAMAVVAVVTLRGDDASDLGDRATTSTDGVFAPGPGEPNTTTTVRGAPIQSPGAAPVSGAILSLAVDDPGRALDVGEETDCQVLDEALTPVGCTRRSGSGGDFLVYVGRHEGGALEARLYRQATPGSTTFSLFRRSQVFKKGGDVVGIRLEEAQVKGEHVVVVDYDFDGSGSVHSFDVVAWDPAGVDPRVVAFINGTGGDRVQQTGEELRFVSAVFDDGAPTCCPNFADIRTLALKARGEWDLTTKRVPFSEAP